ncbi:uncharacterized protein LOC111627277 [Centruroides sculpturatus]|uniref:uncharacterized protein LOC111627277 n=1 Tax=Centruroides sculpturatus TaxID=218467 RepID=UPI000C6E7FF1|nr:uncharacterized protein LOC111627277 [Centruroides sculpturatus]
MSLREFLGKLGIKPREMLFYEQAFTHPSFTNKKGQTENYQRLEFLGDAIISLYVARRVYRLTPPLSEGKMSILKASVVSWANLGALARKLNFQNQIRFAPKAQDLGQNEKILSDVFEAFIAALYLDKGSRSSNHFLDRVLSAQIAGLQGQELKNPKTLLQEYLQRQQART